MADTFTETIRAAVREELAAFSGHVQKRVYTLAEAAQYLGMSEEALRNKVNRNQIPCVRVDNRIRFDRKSLDRWIEENTHYEDE